MIIDNTQPMLHRMLGVLRGATLLRPKENFGQNTVPVHMHDKYAASKDLHRGDDPHGVTGPRPAPVTDEEASVRPVPGPGPGDVVNENTEYAVAATEGVDYTRNQDYGARVQNY